jgi:hypothetical protein
MNLRILIAFFSFVIMVITTVLTLAAYFGDKNEVWAKRMAAIAFVAAIAFLIALFWW